MPARPPSLAHTVLIVEDEQAIAENLLLVLERDGFAGEIAPTARAAAIVLSIIGSTTLSQCR